LDEELKYFLWVENLSGVNEKNLIIGLEEPITL
jgi:hypothetical protein